MQGLRQVFFLSVIEKTFKVLEFLFSAPQFLVLFTEFKAESLLELSAYEIFILEEPPVDLDELVHLLNRQVSGKLTGEVLKLLRVFGPEGVNVVTD